MKDYRLSEIKDICRHRRAKFVHACNDCEFYKICSWQGFESINIEPRDMIELPCKGQVFRACGDFWVVYYRSVKYGCVDGKYFDTESEADAFLENLKKRCKNEEA